MSLIKSPKKHPNINSVINQLLSDKSCLRYKYFKNYLKNTHQHIPESECVKLKSQIESSLLRQFEYYSLLLFCYASKHTCWGAAGQEQALISLARNMLKKKPTCFINKDDLIAFEKILQEKLASHQLSLHNDYQPLLKFFKFKIGSENFHFGQFNLLQNWLNFFETNLIVYAGIDETFNSVFLGKGTCTFFQEHWVYDVKEELIQSHNLSTNIAAIITERNIYLRQTAIQTIFHQKWALHLTSANKNLKNLWQQAGHAIKTKTLSFYTSQSKDIKPLFLEEMTQVILNHEIGHGIIQQHLIDTEISAVGEATHKFGESIFSALLESFADMAPLKKQSKGPLLELIDLSKTQPKQASRMFWMYLSDVWFYDTPDDFMTLYSDIICLILLHVINKNGAVNFQKLSETIAIREAFTFQYPKSILEHLLCYFVEDIKHLIELCKQATFTVNNRLLSFNDINSYLLDLLKKHNPHLSIDSYGFKTLYWTNIFTYVKTFSDNASLLERFLNNQALIIPKKLLCLIIGKAEARAIHYNLRYYILTKCYELKLIFSEPVLVPQKALF